MQITITTIKELRDLTGAGVADCRKALEEVCGDIKKAQEILIREASVKAVKKSEREIKNGLVISYLHQGGKIGVLVKMGCETDFVAKTNDFMDLGKEVAMQVAAMDPSDVAHLLDQDYIRDSSKKIKDLVNDVIAKTGENCSVVEFSRFCI